jgi:hypothetical protein
MKNIIDGSRIEHHGNQGVVARDLLLNVDNEPLDLAVSLAVRNHSPSGFNAGYLGSGCSQSALAILMHVVGSRRALLYYQDFKMEFLANKEYFHNSFTFEVDIAEWVNNHLLDDGLDALLVPTCPICKDYITVLSVWTVTHGVCYHTHCLDDVDKSIGKLVIKVTE